MNNQIQSNYLEVSVVYVNSSILDEETLVQANPPPHKFRVDSFQLNSNIVD